MFGSSQRISNTAPIISSLRIQTSTFGRAIARVYGRTRVSGNLIWYGDFTPIAHTTVQGSGGKGGGVVTSDTTYTYTAAVLIALCSGTIGGVVNVWRAKVQDTLANLGLSLFTGTFAQAPFGYLTTNHPAEALSYRGLAYVASGAYDLGDGAELPNHSFEIDGLLPFSASIKDSNPKDVIVDVLTNSFEGALFPSAKIGDLTQLSNYCVANGIFISPAYTEQQPAHQVLESLARLANAGIVWSEGVLKIRPYSDEAKTGNGATYTPDVTPVYALTDEDFLDTGDDDPVTVERSDPADAFNQVTLKFVNRANEYNDESVEGKDQADIDLYGLRPMESAVEMREIADPAVARVVVEHIKQRSLFVRNKYRFPLPWNFVLLEPMDIVTLTEASGDGLVDQPVLICSIEENEDGALDIEAEDFPAGVTSAVAYPMQQGAGYAADYNVPPGNVNTPVILDAPAVVTDSGFELWLAVSGADVNWGGCQVWVATDTAGPYKNVGSVFGRARHGTLTATLPVGADPDTVNTCAVDLTVSKGALDGGTQADADNLNTLSWIEGELISFQAATLTAAYKYDLGTYLRRGVFNTEISAHASTNRFVRADQALFRYPYDPEFVGKTLYFKLLSFNTHMGALQQLADVTQYPYTIGGPIGAPASVSGFGYSFQGINTRLHWTPVPGEKSFIEYEVRLGAAWETAAAVARTQSDFLLQPALDAPATYLIKARYLRGKEAIAATSVTVTPIAPGQVNVSAMFDGGDVKLTWPVPGGGSYQVFRYEVRHGATWAGGTSAGFVDVTTFRALANWSGSRTWWVTAIDVAGKASTPASVEVVVVKPSIPAITTQVIDNNVLLSWTDATQTLPLKHYELRRGNIFAVATVIGTVQARFSNIFETSGGLYKYWVVGVDSADNYGTEQSAAVTVAAPPDFVLYDQTESVFAGTKTNCLVMPETGKLLACVNTTETFQGHFVNNAWDQPQDQIDAGFPIYIEPSLTTGKYEETLDYGTVIPSTSISVSMGSTVVAGAVTVTPTISVKKLVGDPWTDFAGVWQIYATDFQFVKVTLDFASSGGDDLLTVDSLIVRLDVKIKSDSGAITANSGDAGGTTVTFNVGFIDVRSITVTPQGTTPVTWVVDFADVPNPTSFKVLVFDLAGTRVTREIRWNASGS